MLFMLPHGNNQKFKPVWEQLRIAGIIDANKLG